MIVLREIKRNINLRTNSNYNNLSKTLLLKGQLIADELAALENIKTKINFRNEQCIKSNLENSN